MKSILSFLLILFCSVSFAQDRNRTIDSLQSCLTIAKDDSTRASVLREIGLSYVNAGNYPKGIEMFLKSKHIFQSIKNEYGIFRCDNILGVTYCYMGDNKTALFYLLNAKKGIEDGLIYDNLGLVYYNKNEISESLLYYKKALSFYKLRTDKKLIASKLNDVGSLYEELGQLDTATSYYKESLKISDDKMNLAGAYASLGDISFKRGDFNTALEYEIKSLKLAKEIGDLLSIRETEKMLSDIYLKMGYCETSLVHYKNYISIKDTLINEDNIKQIVRVEENSRFEQEKGIAKVEQAKKDAISEQEKQKQRIIIYSVGVGLVLVLIFSVFIFRALKINQKAKIEITEQKMIVDEKNRDILDSIRYALRIQKAILPPDDFVQDVLPEHFIYFEPKDIVSGDFYFLDKKGNKIFWASCDATGHGTSGSLLSMLGSNILSGIIKDGENIPSKILDKLNERINESLHKTDDASIRDGMDITLCSLETSTMTLNYSGANNPLWIIRNGEIIEYKADKMPIGQLYKTACYTNHEIQLQKGDILYSFSDGICDLHSEENKKFMKKRFRELLLSVQDKPMTEQKVIISETLNKFKGQAEQVDDMLLIGVKV